MRTFELHRDADATGVSGTGIVAQGVEFDDRTAALRWLTEHRSTAIYDSMAALEKIHGHSGTTRVVWTGDVYRRAMTDCAQDLYENAPFASVGGLAARANIQRPRWISPTEWDDYRAGYEAAARAHYGEDWRTCSFGWSCALTLPAQDQPLPTADDVASRL